MNQLHYGLLVTCILCSSLAFSATFPLTVPSGPNHSPPIIGFRFSDLFDQSYAFDAGDFMVSPNYQLWSTFGPRPDRVSTLIPPTGLHMEGRLFYNLGLRLGAGLHVWEEEKVLAESPTQDFTEILQYRYWTAHLGLAWHFNVNDRWDPYIGGDINYRRARGFCECFDDTGTTFSFDVFAGTRVFLSDAFFLNLEFGRTGVGNVKLGLGFKI
ncbi:MAG: outer membrane beta-barrel protein [Bacteroidota bacterium]